MVSTPGPASMTDRATPAMPKSTPSTGAELASQILGERSAIVLDVGGRWGAEASWWRLAPLAKLIGFEPDAAECGRLNALRGGFGEEYVPLALSDSSGSATLHV